MILKYKDLAAAVLAHGSVGAAARALTERLGVPVHKGSLARALRQKRDLELRPRQRTGNLFQVLSAPRLAHLFSLCVRWAIEKVGDSHAIEAWELADLAKDFLIRLQVPVRVLAGGERSVYAYAREALRRYIFLREREWGRHQRRLRSLSDRPVERNLL